MVEGMSEIAESPGHMMEKLGFFSVWKIV